MAALPPHRRFLNRALFNPEELTNYIDSTKKMIVGSDVFDESFAGGVPIAPQSVLQSIDFINHGDPLGPGRQVFWIAMLVHWPEMKSFVEQIWPGSLESPWGKRFLANVDAQITAFCSGKTVDTELLDEMRNAMDICVLEEQMAGAVPAIARDPIANKRVKDADAAPCLEESRRMEKRQRTLKETSGSIAKAAKRPVLLHEEFRERIEQYRENWHLQSIVRGRVTKEVIEETYCKFQRLDFMARILLIITRLEICQRIRLMGKTGDQGVLLEQWVPTGQQYELEDPDELPIDELEDDLDL